MTTDLRTVADLVASLRAVLLARIPDTATSPLAELDMLRAAHERAVREAVAAERARCAAIARREIAHAEELFATDREQADPSADQWHAGAAVAEIIAEGIEDDE